MLPNNYQCEGQISLFEYAPELLSGRTYPEPIPQTTEKTLDVSLRNWQESKTPKFQYLDLRNGCQTELLNFLKGVSHGEPMTLSIGESPQRRRRISLVVDFRDEPRPEIQFIPESLSRNLEQSKEEGEETSRTIGESSDTAISFQERGGKPGGGKGILIQKDHVGALSTLNNQAVLNSSGGDVSGTLDASYYKGCGERQGVEREVLCVGNGQTAQSYLQDRTGALNCMHDQQAVITFSDTHNAHNADDGPKGVHSQMMNAPESNFVVSCGVCYEEPILLESNQNHATVQTDKSTALPASMGMGGGYVPMVCYGLDRASFNQGQNAKYDISIQEDIAQPLVARGPGGVMQTR